MCIWGSFVFWWFDIFKSNSIRLRGKDMVLTEKASKTLVAITPCSSIHNIIKLCQPLKTRKTNKRKGKKIVVCLFVFSFSCSFFYGWHTQKGKKKKAAYIAASMNVNSIHASSPRWTTHLGNGKFPGSLATKLAHSQLLRVRA